MTRPLTDYEKYIRTEELLALQKTDDQLCCPDELTFQMVHQIAELHFKLILQHLQLAKDYMAAERIDDAATQLRRVHIHLQHVPAVFKITEFIEPIEYHTIRLHLGRGSGQDSPGFNQILQQGPTLWEPFQQLLTKRNLTPLALHQNPKAQYSLFQLMQALIEFDEDFQSFRYSHLQMVRRMIGLNVNSLKGVPAQTLQRGTRHEFFPELWQAVCDLTEHTGTSYNAKPLPD